MSVIAMASMSIVSCFMAHCLHDAGIGSGWPLCPVACRYASIIADSCILAVFTSLLGPVGSPAVVVGVAVACSAYFIKSCAVASVVPAGVSSGVAAIIRLYALSIRVALFSLPSMISINSCIMPGRGAVAVFPSFSAV